jgi:hypothetical protein
MRNLKGFGKKELWYFHHLPGGIEEHHINPQS